MIQWTLNHQLKANNWSAENLKKTCDLDERAPEPAIQSCETCQQIPCFDSCQLTMTWMSIIKLNTGYRLPHWLESLTCEVLPLVLLVR